MDAWAHARTPLTQPGEEDGKDDEAEGKNERRFSERKKETPAGRRGRSGGRSSLSRRINIVLYRNRSSWPQPRYKLRLAYAYVYLAGY